MRRKFNPRDLEAIKEALYNEYKLRVEDIVQCEKGLEIYHLGRSVLSPIRLSYDVAREMLENYLKVNEEKTKIIAKIRLKMIEAVGDDNLYTIPAPLMEELQFKMQRGLDVTQYSGKIRPINYDELLTMSVEELKSIERDVSDMEPGNIILIPKNITEEDVDKIIPNLEMKLERFSPALEGADLDTYTGLSWLFEEEIQEADKTASLFNLSQLEIIPGYVLDPFSKYPLRDGDRERLIRDLITGAPINEDIVDGLVSELEKESDWEQHKIREEF